MYHRIHLLFNASSSKFFSSASAFYKDTFAGFADTLRSDNRTTLHYLHDVFFGDAAPSWLTPPKIASDMQRIAEAFAPEDATFTHVCG